MNTISISDPVINKYADTEVILKILSGEKGLYEILLRRNNQKLYRVIRGYLNDHDDIEDIMQETYLSAYEKLHQFKHSSKFSTWLIRIGINKALLHIKKEKPTISLLDDERSLNIASIQPNPENKMIRKESKELVEAAIGNLEEMYRVVYIMREIEKMSIAEISDCLDISQSNAKVRIHRAKSMIKQKLYDLSSNCDLMEFGNKRCDLLVDNIMAQIL